MSKEKIVVLTLSRQWFSKYDNYYDLETWNEAIEAASNSMAEQALVKEVRGNNRWY